MHVARTLRTVLAAVCFVLITLLFLDVTGSLHRWLGWLAKIQFVPALLALHLVVVGILLVVTLLVGRAYCSILCPLGIFQDGVSRMAGMINRRRFAYRQAHTALRYAILIAAVLSTVAGITSVTALLDPYSAYGRMAAHLLGPVYANGNNLLAAVAERMDSYTFYPVDVWMKSAGAFVIALLTLGILSFLAWRNGRLYCTALCPVGTVLGMVARCALFKPRINDAHCTHCGACATTCKTSCIDAASGKIDYSRCVMCLNCLGACRMGGIAFSLPQRPPVAKSATQVTAGKELSRRKFLSLSGLVTLAAATSSYAKVFDGGLAVLIEKKQPKRSTPLVPPGSLGIRNFTKHCTACHLCVSACPHGVLRSDGFLLQPHMSYERGYCRPECTKCAEICPTTAIRAITAVEKSSIQIGHAVWKQHLCIVTTDNVSCTACSRHCPTGAIHLAPQDSDNPASLKIPIIDPIRCIGCGACEHLCPARPYSAIYVEGHERHQIL
jgi:ferredoxin